MVARAAVAPRAPLTVARPVHRASRTAARTAPPDLPAHTGRRAAGRTASRRPTHVRTTRRTAVTLDPLQRATGLSAQEFAAMYWARQPLLRRAAELPGDGFADLLDLDAVDELVSRRGLRTPFLRMAKNGDVIPAGRFTRGGGAGAEIADQVADDRVLTEFADGATLVLQGLHRVWPPVVDFGAALSAQLGHPIQVNAYITPAQNTGFSPHYDVHDVFVLQFAGRKRWRVHQPVLDAPLRDQPWDQRRAAVQARASEEPLIDTVLEPGDALYLPRGYLHSATALGGVSGHLTVGVHPVTRAFLAEQALATLVDDVELRRSLPMGVDLSDPAALDTELKATQDALHRAIDRLDVARVAAAVGRHLADRTRPQPLSPLAQIEAAQSLGPGDAVVVRHGLRWSLRPAGDKITLVLGGRSLTLPASVEAGLRELLSGRVVAIGQVPDLAGDDAVTLVRRLLREGLVVPAGAS
nr:cupin domain-containing protein [Allobranchiibius huperziae]